ncbi:FG-GAP-like repeat-containing protein [Allokutzneria sp. A3M-2-11 16]|uniref:C40 family peptidase n=1 Tax=Allokutzneria sp. A3M-2-11 16 TaxID=2962043 RepID=UPI0020B7A27D|nr:FG-GAP-like repeat-containing protein [Allokutzneria sp. A3M-2-11 16]MCP3803052.1 FG-GAP-like repeat-containing protein [Allokutzneria sp. A3M-2-11 16]
MNLQTRTRALLAAIIVGAAVITAPTATSASETPVVPPGSQHPAPGTQHEAHQNTPVPGMRAPARPVTRTAVMATAKRWVDMRVPYSNHPPYQDGYRRDCSGFVSFAWAADQSYTTNSLDDIAHRISKDDLRAGDMLLWQNPRWPAEYGHVRIFGGWLDGAMSRYWVYEQTPPHAIYAEYTWSRTYPTYQPYRYNHIIDDEAPPPPPPPPSATVKVARHVADIDGDGKPDVLGLNTGSRESLWFVPNTSAPGSLSRGLSVHVSDGWQGVFEHHLADWDGDGKLDILGRSGDDLLVWLNTSIPGKPSFGRFVHLSAGWNALERLVFADFTGDGFVDVGGWNTGSRDQFWVVPNNSRPGVPGRGPSIHVSNGWHTIDTYLVADYDGDGKADLLGRGGDDLVAWRNTGSGGRPSFAPLSRLGSGWNAIGVLVVADFTGDGKPDIGGFDRATGHHFWVTPNTSTPGNLTRGGSYHVSDGWSNVSGHLLGDWDGDGKTDILGRAGDALLAWRNTSADGRTSLAPYTHFGTGWATLGTFLTKH